MGTPLTLAADQATALQAMDTDIENSFSGGVNGPGGQILKPIPNYDRLKASDKIRARQGMMQNLAAIYSQIVSYLPVKHVVGAGGEPAFQNSFAQWGDATFASGHVRYYKTLAGQVRVEGLVATVASPNSKTIFTLPAGFRPASGDGHIFSTIGNDSGTVYSMQVLDSGAVSVRSGPTTGWFSLDNIAFQAGA